MRWFLLASCLILGALAAAQWWLWPVQRPIIAKAIPGGAQDAGAGETGIPQYQLPPMDDFEEIGERPLFVDGRRPPDPNAAETDQPAPAPVVTKPLPGHLGLTAILMTPEGPKAWVRDGRENETLRLAEGEDLAGWKIASILQDRLILTQGKQSQEMLLRLFDLSPPPPPAMSRKPRATRKSPAKKTPVKRVSRARRPIRK